MQFEKAQAWLHDQIDAHGIFQQAAIVLMGKNARSQVARLSELHLRGVKQDKEISFKQFDKQGGGTK